MENKISVIVTTYNQQYTIGRTLESILMQRCHLPLEIVIGEDCSTDATRKVCESYAQRYPRIVRLMPKAPNKGIIANYYDCLIACTGEYIADCAGDDFWTDSYKLEKELTVMEKNPSVTLVHTNWQFYDEDTKKTKPNTYIPFKEKITSGKNMLEAIITQTKAPVIHTCTALYRAKTIRECYNADKQLFRNKEHGCEDLQLVFMLALKGDIAFLPDITLNYSVGHSSVSSQPDERKQFRFVQRTASLSFMLSKRYGIETKVTRNFFEAKAFALCMHAFRTRDKQLAKEAYRYASLWNADNSNRIKFAKLIMANNITWKAALLLRQTLVACKRLANSTK